MPFGLNFGSKKEKISGSKIIDQLETTNQSATENQQQAQQSSSTTNQTSSSTGSTTQNTASSGTSSTTGNTTQNTTQTTNLFSDQTLASLDETVQRMLANAQSQSQMQQVTRDQLVRFDPVALIKNGLARATMASESDVATKIAGLADAVGGAESNNSMLALLGGRIRNEAGASLAGVESDLTAKATELAAGNLGAIDASLASGGSTLQGLLQALKGGVSTTIGAATGSSSESQQQAQTGSQTGTSRNDSVTNSTTDTTQVLISLIDKLMNGTTNTHGTETSEQKSKGSSFGLSLSK